MDKIKEYIEEFIKILLSMVKRLSQLFADKDKETRE